MPIVTLPGGELRDEIRQITYDTVTIMPGELLAGTRVFFQSLTRLSFVLLGAVTQKSVAFTNMRQPGSLGSATSFRHQGFSFEAHNSVLANALLLPVVLQKSSLTLTVGEKIYWQGPARFAAGRMLESYPTTAAQTFVSQQYGWPAICPLVFQGKHVIDINPLQPFRVTWEIAPQDLTAAEAAITPPAGAPSPFQLAFKGLLRRPVQ